jgi:hypothetical protein
MPYFSNARTATHSGAVRPQQVNEFACALLDFKQQVPKGRQIELNSVVDQNFLATTQISRAFLVGLHTTKVYSGLRSRHCHGINYTQNLVRTPICSSLAHAANPSQRFAARERAPGPKPTPQGAVEGVFGVRVGGGSIWSAPQK